MSCGIATICTISCIENHLYENARNICISSNSCFLHVVVINYPINQKLFNAILELLPVLKCTITLIFEI